MMEHLMSPANPYIGLLAEFQEAYALHGRSYLWLGAVTPEELRAYPFLRNTFIGIVPSRELAWNIVGEICHASRFGAGGAYRKRRAASLEVFCRLASRAGAALPLSIRMKIPGYPTHVPTEPLSWWVTFLWHLSPPSEEDLAPPPGQSPPVRIACLDPFQASIDAIESCGLRTDEPQFLPGGRRSGGQPSTEPALDLDQIAAFVHLKKRSMENYKYPKRKKDPLPDPDYPGKRGQRDLWKWSTIHPWLKRTFNLPIPEALPDVRRS
jgi:hypothetical protein